MKPTKLDLPYLSPETDRHGNRAVYVRRYGRRIRIRHAPGTPAFLEAYTAALDALGGRRRTTTAIGPKPAPRGSLGWLGAQYFASQEFKALDRQSQATRRLVLESCFREPYRDDDPDPMGNCPLVHVTALKVKRLRDLKAGKPGAANNRRKYLSALFGGAVEVGLMKFNPARDVRRVKYASEGFHSWTVEEGLA